MTFEESEYLRNGKGISAKRDFTELEYSKSYPSVRINMKELDFEKIVIQQENKLKMKKIFFLILLIPIFLVIAVGALLFKNKNKDDDYDDEEESDYFY